MRLRSLGVLAVLAVVPPAMPASAVVDVPVFSSGGISVYSDLTACANIAFPTPPTFVGAFSGAGFLTGPGTIVAPIAGAVPVTGTNATDWGPRCIPGGYSGATAGQAVFAFEVSTTHGSDYVAVVQCAVVRGTVRCV